MHNEFSVDSSTYFPFRAHTHTQSQTPLITLPTDWLLLVWVIIIY